MKSALEIAQSGFDVWAAKPHNKKWFRRVDGTPIPNDLVVCIAQAFSEASALASVAPSGAEPVAKKRYCQCNSLTNPCIVCGLPKFIDPTWLRRKIEEDPNEGEIGAGFELFSGITAPPHNAKWSPEEVKRVARRAVELWRDSSGVESIDSPDVLVGNVEAAITAAIAVPQAVAPAEEIAGLISEFSNGRFSTWMDALAWCSRALTALTSLSAERDEARSGLAELDQVFDKLWEADRRAIKLWQEATGRDHIWPDRTKMTLWLLERLTASEAEATSLRRKLEEHRKALEPFGRENDLPANLPDETRLTITFAGQQVAHATFGDFRRARVLSEREGQE